MFDQIDDILHGMRLRQAARVAPPWPATSAGSSSKAKISCARRSAGELGLRDQARRARAFHFLGVAQLVAVGGGAEGNEDGGASGRRDFRRGDRARAANDQVRLGKTLGNVSDKGQNLRVDFSPRIRLAHSIIVALAGLVDDGDALFSVPPTDRRRRRSARLIASAPWLPPVIRM